MRVLRNPSQGVEVTFLQCLLNKAARSSRGRLRGISEDGLFRGATQRAVRAFQSSSHTPRLVDDGIVGRHTWHALGLRVDIEHRITLRAQMTNWNCWQAAATMVGEARGYNVSVATSPEHMQHYLMSGASGRAANEQLARELGWNLLNHSPSLPELEHIMRRTPIYVSGILTSTGGAHAVAFGGLYSDKSPGGTIIKVYNPSPVGAGMIHALRFTSMVSPISGSLFLPNNFMVPP